MMATKLKHDCGRDPPNHRHRSVQAQGEYGKGYPTDKTYYRVRIPQSLAIRYISEFGDRRFARITAKDTMRIGRNTRQGVPIHILEVREVRDILYHRFYQVSIPVEFSSELRGKEYVCIWLDKDDIVIRFQRNVFYSEFDNESSQ